MYKLVILPLIFAAVWAGIVPAHAPTPVYLTVHAPPPPVEVATAKTTAYGYTVHVDEHAVPVKVNVPVVAPSPPPPVMVAVPEPVHYVAAQAPAHGTVPAYYGPGPLIG